MSKKIVMLLSVVMLLQSFGTGVLAANETEDSVTDVIVETTDDSTSEIDEYSESIKAEKRKEIEEEIAVLTSAGIIDLEEDYDPTAVVTRAEFATYTAAAIKADAPMPLSYFTDVPTNHWASDSINQLTDLKVIDRAADGLFNPDRIISYVEACKIMTMLTRYKAYTRSDKDMTQYITIAESAGFGIVPSNPQEMTIADTVKLLYKAMQVDMVMVDSVTVNKYTVKPNEDNNLFSVYHNIKFDDAILEATFEKRMVDTKLKQGEVMIGGTRYYADSSVVPGEYFGRELNFAYREDKEDVDMTVLYAEPKFSDAVRIL